MRQITNNLGFCDYPIRSANTKTFEVTMPIAGIPEFDRRGATLILRCEMGTTAIKSEQFGCPKIAGSDYQHKKRSYFFPEEPVAPNQGSVTNLVVYNLSMLNFLLMGSFPCFAFFTDLYETSYYLFSEYYSI